MKYDEDLNLTVGFRESLAPTVWRRPLNKSRRVSLFSAVGPIIIGVQTKSEPGLNEPTAACKCSTAINPSRPNYYPPQAPLIRIRGRIPHPGLCSCVSSFAFTHRGQGTSKGYAGASPSAVSAEKVGRKRRRLVGGGP
jgi:hypothetical protein